MCVGNRCSSLLRMIRNVSLKYLFCCSSKDYNANFRVLAQKKLFAVRSSIDVAYVVGSTDCVPR